MSWGSLFGRFAFRRAKLRSVGGGGGDVLNASRLFFCGE